MQTTIYCLHPCGVGNQGATSAAEKVLPAIGPRLSTFGPAHWLQEDLELTRHSREITWDHISRGTKWLPEGKMIGGGYKDNLLP